MIVGFDAAAGGRLTTVSWYAAIVPLHACRPAMGLRKPVEMAPVYPPVTNDPPAAMMSWKAPAPILISRTPPSKKLGGEASSVNLFRKLSCVAPAGRTGESRTLSVTCDGSSVDASFGAVSGVVVTVLQAMSPAWPVTRVVDHPAGSAGGVTLSKFSLRLLQGSWQVSPSVQGSLSLQGPPAAAVWM